MMGVRIYARGKIVGVTRDFNQPAGFTGEFTMRSYLVGQVEAEWLDLDNGEDLVPAAKAGSVTARRDRLQSTGAARSTPS